MPRVAKQVIAMLQSAEGGTVGTPRDAGVFRTMPSQAAPRPYDGLRINPAVGPDHFNLDNVGQDKPGFAYIVVTRANTGPTPQVWCRTPVCLDCLQLGHVWGWTQANQAALHQHTSRISFTAWHLHL